MRARFRSTVLPLLAIVASLAATALPTHAQQCASRGSKPMVCRIEVRDVTATGRPVTIDLERGLDLRSGQRVVLDVVAYDQSGRPFPEERLAVRMDGEEGCRGRVEIDQSRGLFDLKGIARGSCELTLWIPGNLNLEWPLRVAVDREERRGGTSRGTGEVIAGRLYQAILGREADAGGLRSAAAAIDDGRLEEIVDSLLASDEFRRERWNLSPTVLLQDFYRGLLDRDPDPAGVKTYWEEVRRHRFAEVLLSLLRSPEFDELVRRGTGRR